MRLTVQPPQGYEYFKVHLCGHDRLEEYFDLLHIQLGLNIIYLNTHYASMHICDLESFCRCFF